MTDTLLWFVVVGLFVIGYALLKIFGLLHQINMHLEKLVKQA